MPDRSEHYSTAVEGGRLVCRRLTVHGQFDATAYLAFVADRAAWLSLDGDARADADGIVLTVAGPEALVGALEMACTLGPLAALVHSISAVDSGETPGPGFRIAQK